MGKVLLIAGHGKNYNGSYDPGACSVHGQEADYTRELVTMVQQAIGAAVPLDIYDLNKNCYSYSKAGQAPVYGAYNLVVEIHFNAKAKKDPEGDGRFTGIGAYVHPNNGGKTVAEQIVNAVAALGFKCWMIADSTGLLNLNNAQKAGTRYLLLETAFIDDGDDMAWYNANKTAVAKAIAQEIIKAAGGNATASTPVQRPGISESNGYMAGMYKVNVDDLKIRSGPGTGYDIVWSIWDYGTYTIVEMSGSWGRLKSGAGWINCSTKYCTRVGDAALADDAEPEDAFKPIEVRVKAKDIRIRKGPGLEYGIVEYCPVGVYNIVETVQADGYTWGRLLSGAGWIALENVERL